ncbi:hypothetical protein PIB30_015452 [Stylosanthes scabra]|uniref:DUF4037 domain-containing protein n=1 Tax=Stylosanthes scabra TaxID=79078 RepID=A0ABU6U8S1_9FABA|nr:hypothetical protein [Stylosanthes scabra]
MVNLGFDQIISFKAKEISNDSPVYLEEVEAYGFSVKDNIDLVKGEGFCSTGGLNYFVYEDFQYLKSQWEDQALDEKRLGDYVLDYLFGIQDIHDLNQYIGNFRWENFAICNDRGRLLGVYGKSTEDLTPTERKLKQMADLVCFAETIERFIDPLPIMFAKFLAFIKNQKSWDTLCNHPYVSNYMEKLQSYVAVFNALEGSHPSVKNRLNNTILANLSSGLIWTTKAQNTMLEIFLTGSNYVDNDPMEFLRFACNCWHHMVQLQGEFLEVAEKVANELDNFCPSFMQDWKRRA